MEEELDHFPEDAPRPRQCHLVKWPEFDGYGFNLHAEKSKPGQYVGKVDPGSPAEFAGLKEGDRIVEVNGVNINHENHKQVVQRIKAMPGETTLLVVDLETEEYYRQREVVVRCTMSNVLRRSADRSAKPKEDEKEDVEDELSAGESVEKTPPPAKHRHASSSGSTGMTPSPRSTPSPDHTLQSQSSRRSDWDGLNLNMSAAEMRERIGSRKKRDPRKDDRMDFKTKHDIILSL